LSLQRLFKEMESNKRVENDAQKDARLTRAMARTLRAAPSGLRIIIRFQSGASRRPSSGCSGRSSTRASSRVRPPLIRSPVRP